MVSRWSVIPECNGELLVGVWLVADGHHAGLLLADDAAVVLLPGHAVDDVLLHLSPLHGQVLPPVPGTDQVQLVILPRQVALPLQKKSFIGTCRFKRDSPTRFFRPPVFS